MAIRTAGSLLKRSGYGRITVRHHRLSCGRRGGRWRAPPAAPHGNAMRRPLAAAVPLRYPAPQRMPRPHRRAGSLPSPQAECFIMAGIVADVLDRGRRLARLALLPMLAAFVLAALPPAGIAAAAPPEVSFDPAPQSADFLDLFTHPESWAEARRRTGIFIIGPAHLKHGEGGNSFEQLVAVDAFRKLQQWGLKTEIAVGVIKNWDCAAKTTAERTLANIADIHRNGGKVDLASMDEPLLAAVRLQLNEVERCHLSIAQAAEETAAFTRQVAAGVTAQQLGPAPGFIDIEPYPSVQLDQHEAYVTALLAQGFHPAGYMLDIAMAQ